MRNELEHGDPQNLEDIQNFKDFFDFLKANVSTDDFWAETRSVDDSMTGMIKQCRELLDMDREDLKKKCQREGITREEVMDYLNKTVDENHLRIFKNPYRKKMLDLLTSEADAFLSDK